MEEDKLPVIDLELGARLLGADIAVAKQMLTDLMAMLPGDLERVKTAFEADDYPALEKLGHYIHGGATYCGVPRLQVASLKLQKALHNKLDPLVIEAAYHRLCQEIEAVIKENQ